jgi:hypothetical protein
MTDELKALAADRRDGKISLDEYSARFKELRAQMAQKRCSIERGPRAAEAEQSRSPAAWTAGIGGITIGFGVVLLVVAATSQGFELAMVGAVFVTIGLVMLLIALIVAVVRAAKAKRRRGRH